MLNHITKIHYKKNDNKKWKCELCDKYFSEKSALTFHRKIHMGINFPCDDCGHQFTQKANLKKHRLRLHVSDPRISWIEHKIMKCITLNLRSS